MPDFSTSPVTRRTTLAGLAGGVALAAMPVRLLGAGRADSATFRHGVASGDPDRDSVVLWTRVSAEGPVPVRWELSETEDFGRVLKHGSLSADAERDHTVKVLAQGLRAGATYYYRFVAAGETSPVGRTRTLPAGRLDRLGIALVSCSNYAFGFFNAYDAIARDPGVDYVLHTGDYIYEYGADGWGHETANRIGRVHEPAHEIVSLDDYRRRHAQYKADAGSLAMLAAHPLLACWDDHESANNPWTGGAENHQPATEGDWQARRAASVRAYYEWMPVREPEWLERKGLTRMQFWRSYSFGDLATLCTLETRHTARAKQIDYLEHAAAITGPETADRFRKQVLGGAGRTMISAECERDLAAALSGSVRAGQPWRLIGNAIPIARTDVPDLVAMGMLDDPAPRLVGLSGDELRKVAAEAAVSMAWKGRLNLPFYLDTWDGYPWARERLYALSRDAGAGDLIFLTGDSHSFWANQLADDAGRPAGIELGTAGVTSPGDFIESGFAPDKARKLDEAFAKHNPEIVWTDNMHQGYVRIDLTRDSGSASFVAMDTLLSTRYAASTFKRMAFARSGGSVRFS